MTKYLIANWKCHKNVAEVRAWLNAFSPFAAKLAAQKELEFVLCPALIHLPLVKSSAPQLKLGSQTLSPFPNGTYTGAVSAQMVSEFAQYAILGHAERRKFFGESNPMVANQAIQALENHLTPILAVDDTNWADLLGQLNATQQSNCLVMYEPPEAISMNGENHPADITKVAQAAQLIASHYRVKGIVYGGSVTTQTVRTYWQDPTLSGIVLGNASLDVVSFMALVQAVTAPQM